MQRQKKSEIDEILDKYVNEVKISVKENVKILTLELKNLSSTNEAKLSRVENIILRHIERDTQTLYKTALAKRNLNEFDKDSEKLLNKSYIQAVDIWEQTLRTMNVNLSSFFEKLRKR